MDGKELYQNCINEIVVGSLKELNKFLPSWDEMDEIDKKFWEDEAVLEKEEECQKQV